MTLALELHGVSKRFGQHQAVDRLDLAIPTGCIYGFLGPNGAGKTTTIRMVMSILMPDEGRITVLGNDVPEAVKDRLGFLPEEKGLYKKMRVADLVTYFGRLKGLSNRDAKTRARSLLEKSGLGAWADKRCEELSKGMGQKVQVLATLIHDPELVILDEPFSGLDPINQVTLRELILDIKAQGRTVIFSTHVMEQAEQICDSVVLINRGRKRIDGPLQDVRRSADRGIRLDYEGDPSVLASLPGVARISDSGKSAEIYLQPGVDPQEILKMLVGRITIRRFDVREASLHEIFVRTVGADDAASEHSAGEAA